MYVIKKFLDGKSEVTFEEYGLLETIRIRGGCTEKDLYRMSSDDIKTTDSILLSLVKKGYLEKELSQ